MSSHMTPPTSPTSWCEEILSHVSQPKLRRRQELLECAIRLTGTGRGAALLWLWDPERRSLALNLYVSNVTDEVTPPLLMGALVPCTGVGDDGIYPEGGTFTLTSWSHSGVLRWSREHLLGTQEETFLVRAEVGDRGMLVLGVLHLLSESALSDVARTQARELASGLGALLARSREERQLNAVQLMLKNRESKIDAWLRVAAEALREITSAEAALVFRHQPDRTLHSVVIDPRPDEKRKFHAKKRSVIRVVAEKGACVRVLDFADADERLHVFETTEYDSELLDSLEAEILKKPLKSILLGPVVFEGHSLAVVALLNKKTDVHLAGVFSKTDEDVLKTTCSFLAGVLPSLELYAAVGRMATIVFPGALNTTNDRQRVFDLLTDLVPNVTSAAFVRRRKGEAEPTAQLLGGHSWFAAWAASAPASDTVQQIPARVVRELSVPPESYYEKRQMRDIENDCWIALGFSRRSLTSYERQILSFFYKELSHVLKAEQALDNVVEEFVQLRHAVRSGLTGVVGYVKEALDSYNIAREHAPLLLTQARFRKALERANFATAKTRMLLEESRYLLGQITRASLRLGASSISSLVREVVECLRPIAELRSIEIILNNTVQADQDRVTMDRQLVEITIFNIVDNAIKYSHRKRRVFVSLSIKGSHWKLDVTDEGVFIREEDRALIFEPFKRRPTGPGAESRPGTGLGLAVGKTIAEVHNGEISVTSAHLGDYARTTFALRIPREQKL